MTWRKRAQRIVELASWGVGVYLLVAMVLTPWILVALLAFAGLWWLWDRLDREPEPEPPVSVEEVLARQRKVDDRFALVVAALLGAVVVVLLLTGCAHAHTTARPDPTPKVEATMVAYPHVALAGNLVLLWARLKDPLRVLRCPSLTWVWPDDTRSSHTEDCDPNEAIDEHVESRRVVVGHGDNTVSTIWRFEGREWRASVTVPVP